MDVVVTSLLTAEPDPQRNRHLPSSVDAITRLRDSVARHNRHLAVIHDCLDEPNDDHTTFVRVDPGGNPYFRRWAHIDQWLGRVPAVKRVWCVDGTDVIMLHDPFPHMRPGVVYSGSEPYQLAGNSDYHKWLRNTCPSRRAFYKQHPDRPFLNMGLLGGAAADIRLAAMLLADSEADGDRWEMGAWQSIAFNVFGARLITGHPIHTEYRANDHADPEAWWAHQ